MTTRDVVATRSAHEKRSGTSATNCFVVRDTLHHSDVAEYRRLYPITIDARPFGAISSDGRSSTMFGRLGIRRDTNIRAWNRGWASTGQWCGGIINPVGHFGLPLVRHADEVTYVRALREMLCGTEGDWGLVGKYELVCLVKPYKKFNLVKHADV